MKKNRFMRLASCLLILCLITTCAISTTFAKYVSGDSASDTARVAKWGIEVSTSGTLFGSAYSATSGDSIIATDGAVSVKAFDSSKVVAPGTKNDVGFQIALSGTPEVQYNTTATADIKNEDISLAVGNYGVMAEQSGVNAATDKSALYTLDGTVYKLWSALNSTEQENYTGEYYKLVDAVEVDAVYYPINWKVDGGAAQKNIVTIASGLADTISAKDGNANSPITFTKTLTWEWVIGNNEAANADTILGNLMAEKTNVVVKNTDNTYSAIVVNGTDKNATATVDGTPNTPIANLEVYFGIDVVVSQVD